MPPPTCTPGATASLPPPTPHAVPRPRAVFLKQEHRDWFHNHRATYSWQFHMTRSTSPDEHNSEYLAFQTTNGQNWVFGNARYDSVRWGKGGEGGNGRGRGWGKSMGLGARAGGAEGGGWRLDRVWGPGLGEAKA